MSKSITEQEVTQRMMDRWTLELANWLMSEKDLKTERYDYIFKEMEEEFEVLVSEKLIKTTSVFTSNVHTCVDRDYDAATGRYEYSSTVEPDGNLKEVFEEQQRSALKIIECCEKLCAQLLKDGKRIYADIKIADLHYDCSDWEQLELTVE